MNKIYIIAGAVAAALGTQSAQALNVVDTLAATKLVVSGASAQRDTFKGRLTNDLCVAGTMDTYQANDSIATTSEDFKAWSCTTKTNAINPDIPVAIENKNIVVYYRSEGGSVYGVGPLLSTNASFATGVSRLLVDATCANPTLTNTTHDCVISGYNLDSDTDTTTPSRLVQDPTQVGVSDEEPAQFKAPNWPTTSAALGAAPTASQLTALNAQAQLATGTVFGVVVSTSGSPAGLTNLPRQTLTSIFAVQTTDWGKVIDPSTNTALTSGSIILCRREPGSGTQVAASIYFNGTNCVSSAINFPAGNGATVIENSTSDQMKVCVAQPNAIGFLSYGGNPTGAKFISIDGIAPNKQNASLGLYGFNFESTIQKRTGLTGDALTLANTLITLSRRQAAQATGATQASFALPISGVNTPSIANALADPPVSLGFRNKTSCKAQLNQL